jgi:hypothetical protein
VHEVDLIPASYRRERSRALWIKWIGALTFGLVMTTAGARVWLDSSINTVDAQVARLQMLQTITTGERDQLAALSENQKNYQDQLYLLKGLRSGAATADLFGIIDQALIGDELWFRRWEFRRAGVTNAEGQSVETGYFIVVSNDGTQNDSWRVETHMTIAGQAQDHAALSEFVQRLLSHPEIENVHVRRTELRRYASRSLVDFDIAVIINRQARR